MIYCVIPRELEDELYERMVAYYGDNPNVTVIVDRRTGPGPPPGQVVRRYAGAARPPPPPGGGNVPQRRRRLEPPRLARRS